LAGTFSASPRHPSIKLSCTFETCRTLEKLYAQDGRPSTEIAWNALSPESCSSGLCLIRRYMTCIARRTARMDLGGETVGSARAPGASRFSRCGGRGRGLELRRCRCHSCHTPAIMAHSCGLGRLMMRLQVLGRWSSDSGGLRTPSCTTRYANHDLAARCSAQLLRRMAGNRHLLSPAPRTGSARAQLLH
jgi:hypothetical protein